MSSENLHAPRDRLSAHTLGQHHALVSLIEELEAVDWYRQRADDCDEPALREILLHNMREEMEHAAMVLEWIRRNSSEFDEQLRAYLFTDAPITAAEAEATGGDEEKAPEGGHRGNEAPDPQHTYTIGDLKE